MARHREINEKYRGEVSKEKITILEQDIDLLWEKVCVYEIYAAEERNLRVKAVEAFRNHETRMFGRFEDYDKNSSKKTHVKADGKDQRSK